MSVPTLSRLSRYLTLLLRWLLIAIVVFVVTIFSGIYITDNILPKVYTARAQIMVRPRSSVSTARPDKSSQDDSPTFQTELETMESPEVLLSVIKDLGLDRIWAKRVYNSDEDQLPDVDALTHMEKVLRFDVKSGTNVIEINASSDVPKEAADIANAVVDQYKTIRDSEQNQGAGQAQPESSVVILTRAEPPVTPSKPNKSFDLMVTIVVATFLSIALASFNEVILLLLRASERTEN